MATPAAIRQRKSRAARAGDSQLIQVRLSPEIVAWADAQAAESGTSRAAVIESALREQRRAIDAEPKATSTSTQANQQ